MALPTVQTKQPRKAVCTCKTEVRQC